MNIKLINNKLKKYANNDKAGVKKLRELRHKRDKQRLDQLKHQRL